MYFLFSGEGPTDLGSSASPGLIAEGDDFLYGPMAILADQIVFNCHSYSLLETRWYGYVSEGGISQKASEIKAVKKALGLPGVDRPKETRYYFNTARILSRIAKEKQTATEDEVVAILFRDSDGTASAGRGLWEDKLKSMSDGFLQEGFERGVPMIPKPKSEAWLICGLKAVPYEGCEVLEARSGNDDSPHSLKKELLEILPEIVTRADLVDVVKDRIDFTRLEMPSFRAFQRRLEQVC